LLKKADVEGKSLEELALLRNEIYARKGHKFETGKYRAYFTYKKWYKPLSSNDGIELSSIENKNVAFLKSLENKIQKKRDAAIRDLKELKIALEQDDWQVIGRFMSEIKKESYYKSIINSMKEAFSRIDLDNIHWNKGRGLYRTSIDNGYQVSEYEIYIEGDTIKVSLGDQRHSDIFGDFNDGYSDYDSINEYSLWWIFEMQESGIVFKYFAGAG